MKSPLYILEQKVGSKGVPQRFWVGVVRAMLADNPRLRVRRVKSPEEAIMISDPAVSMLDFGDIIKRNSHRYEWVE